MATNSSFSLFLGFSFRPAPGKGAYRKRFLFRHRLQDCTEALADRWPVVAGGGLGGGFFVAATQFRISQQHEHGLGERNWIVGQNNVAAVMNIGCQDFASLRTILFFTRFPNQDRWGDV